MATDFISFNEGEDSILSSGMPSTCYFLLSTKSCSGTSPFSSTDTLAGGVGEITGTGYARKNQALPTPTAGALAFTLCTWTTGSATDWPATVRSIVLVTTADNSGKAICAWNLIPGNGVRDLSHALTAEFVTPTLTTESVDVSFATTVAQAIVTGSPAGPTAFATPTIIHTNSAAVDVGSNLFNNGTYEIYLVPSTGVYEVAIELIVSLDMTGGTQMTVDFGYAVGSSSAGSPTASGNSVADSVANPNTGTYVGGQHTIALVDYIALTAGQYVNMTILFPATATATSFTALLLAANLNIKRIA
jgi:hypothetical protein